MNEEKEAKLAITKDKHIHLQESMCLFVLNKNRLQYFILSETNICQMTESQLNLMGKGFQLPA